MCDERRPWRGNVWRRDRTRLLIAVGPIKIKTKMEIYKSK